MSSVSIRDQLGIKPLSEIASHLNCLIYGIPGVGKTYLAATAQDHKDTTPVLHLGFEMGLQTIAYRKNYDAIEVRTMEDLIKYHDILEQDQLSKTPHYKCVIVDNITEVQKLDMGWVMRETKRTARNPDNVDIDVPSPREWGKSGERMRRIIRAFRDMPVHTIFTAWRGEQYDEATNQTSYYPLLPGKLRAEIPGYFDIVGYYTVDIINNGESTIRNLQVQGTKRVIAKDRTSSLGVVDGKSTGVVTNPTIPGIWETIQTNN